MRIRNVKPEFYRSDDVDALTWDQRFLFIALFSYVDDNGVGRDRESDICADLFAGDFSVEPGETLGRVREGLRALMKRGLVVRYEVDGKRFLYITGWDKHQYVKNPNKERYPRPDKALLQSSVDPGETQSSPGVSPPPDVPPVVGSKSLVVGSGLKVVPTTSGEETSPPGAETAQTLIGEWIGDLRSRPPHSVVGQVSKHVKSMLEEGIPADVIREALALWQRKKLNPSVLASVVHEVQNKPEEDRRPEWMR